MSARRWIAVSLLLTVSFLIFLNCAKVMPPPGGPEDKTGPNIMGTYPPANAVNVPSDNKISIQFSERVDKKKVSGAIFISPRFDQELKYKWNKNNLIVQLPDSFASNVTYVINIGSDISDIHNNKMDNSYSFAFSTGKNISSGKIKGTVYKDGKAASGITIGLYEFNIPNNTIVFDSIYSPYMTVSGKSGEYALDYLPDGDYFILAFDDKNRNQLFNFPKENFGVSDRAISIPAQNKYESVNLHLIQEDTSEVSALSLALTPNNLVKIRLSHPVKPEEIRDNISHFFLIPQNESKTAITPVSVKERGNKELSTYNFFFKGIESDSYRLKIPEVISGGSKLANDMGSSLYSLELNEDDVPPEIESFSHENAQTYPLDSVLTFIFSEPINRAGLTDESIKIADENGTNFRAEMDWSDDFSLKIPVPGLGWGNEYNVIVKEADIIDYAGNLLGDSLIQYSFSIYNHDSLGSVSGKVEISPYLDTAGLVYLTFSRDGKEILHRPVTGNSFNFELPPGKYVLDGFIDKNVNGVQDFGGLFPFRYSETSAHYPDTIRVRARFETSGIEFKLD